MSIRTPLLALAALAVLAPSAHAASLLSVGFESPYTVGNLGTQQGWLTDLTRPSDATVTTARAFAGSNSLLMHADAGDYGFAYKTFSYTASTNADKQIRMDTQIWVTGSGETQTNEGASGFDVYAGATEGAGALIGAGTGNVYFYDDVDGFVSLTGGPTATLNAWNKLSILLDFRGATPTYYAGINDNLINLTTLGFTTGFTAASTITDADYLAIGGTAVAANTYFDQLNVQTVAAVPEPTTLAALGLGAVAMLRRRKRA